MKNRIKLNETKEQLIEKVKNLKQLDHIQAERIIESLESYCEVIIHLLKKNYE